MIRSATRLAAIPLLSGAIVVCSSMAFQPVIAQPAPTDGLVPTKSTAKSDDGGQGAATSKPDRDSIADVPGSVTKLTEFTTSTVAMRAHLKEMRETMIRYQLSSSPAEGKRIKSDWVTMLDKGRGLHTAMVKASVVDFEKEPALDGELASFLFDVAARNANADRYDVSLPVVKSLASHGFMEETFNLCAALTASAHNEFDFAKPFLAGAMKDIEESMEALATKSDAPPEQKQKIAHKAMELLNSLADYSDTAKQEELWAAEKKLRQADAEGEPLPRVRITTTKGSFEIELFENQAPNTVANFISLCEKGFYDNLPFHRVLEHFMAQTGCPNGDGTGGPDYVIPGELDRPDRRNFFRGTLGMALSADDPNSAGSQFFICYMPRSHLNGHYVAFGRVIENMDVLSDITRVDPDEKKEDKSHSHDAPDEIVSTKVLRKRSHPYEPTKLPLPKR